MDEKVEQLKDLYNSLDTLIYILEGNFTKESIKEAPTVRGQIGCFGDLGADIQAIIDEILIENGDDPCPCKAK